VPATERSFTDAPPARLYVDTDIFVSYLDGTQPHHTRCKAFLEALAEGGLTEIFISSLTGLEFAHVVMRENFRSNLPPELWRRYRLHRWNEPLVRQAYLQALIKTFESVLTQFKWAEVSLTPAIRIAAIRAMGQHNLGSQDAVHLVSARHAGLSDLASLDERYRRVDGLNLWNDRIHTRQSR
jgi:predicted nucleic acid-binding protein